jgi:hypothetical protein
MRRAETRSRVPSTLKTGDKPMPKKTAKRPAPETVAPAQAAPEKIAPQQQSAPMVAGDEFYNLMTRKLLTFIGQHRRCREPVCRRLKRCAGADYPCQRDNASPPLTEAERSKVSADLAAALKRVKARRAAPRR